MNMHINHRILVIDDHRAIHDDFRKILTPESDGLNHLEADFFGEAPAAPLQPVFEMDSAYQGEEGVAKLGAALDEGRPYAVAFIDVRMPPGIDGIETAELLWQKQPELQIVICTAHCDYSWEDVLARFGCRDRLLILKKPFAPVEVQQLACALCEKWTLTREAGDRLAATERAVAERTRDLQIANDQLQAEMTQRKEAEAQLLRAQRLESIGVLAGGIAHDLNNMLAPILMCSQLMRETPPEGMRELIEMIEGSAERAARVVKQVLTFARGIEGERVPLQPKPLIREMERIIMEIFPRVIRLESRIASDVSLIEGDATQLHQVLMNLSVNARDSMPDGGTLRIEAEDFEVDENYASMTPDARVGRYVRLRVSDTGCGIPKHLLEKIFDPFFTTKRLGEGTGLGLSTVFGIVRSHQGFIEVRSELGQGATFDVFLPAVFGSAAAPESPDEWAAPHGKGELILVVDDESAIRKVTESVLAKHGYRTVSAADGAEAIFIYARQGSEIAAVFTDVMMPFVDGVGLCRVLKKMDPGIRILAATGLGEENHLQQLRALDVETVLQKPFATGSLLKALAEVLGAPAPSAHSSPVVTSAETQKGEALNSVARRSDSEQCHN